MSIAARRIQRVKQTTTPPPQPSTTFGPDGTHWPASTPRTGHTNVVDVACSWSAISTAIGNVTSQQAAAGTLIRVAPGTLPGSGDGVTSGATPMLQNVGSSSWSQNILVAPRDGWGTVSIASGIRIHNVHGTTFARFNGSTIIFTSCGDMSWAQSKMSLGIKTFADNDDVEHCNIYEMVMLNSRADENDACQYRAGTNHYIRNCTWEGCYIAPLFRPTGSSAHLDTFQMFGNGWYRGLTFRDCLIFASNNCAVQGGGFFTNDPYLGQPFVTFDHSMLVSQALAAQLRYSVPSGATGGGSQAINGSGESPTNGGSRTWYAYDSYILGSMHTTEYVTIQDSYTSYSGAVGGNQATNGAWVYDSSWGSKTPSQFDAMVGPEPDDTYLATIWAS